MNESNNKTSVKPVNSFHVLAAHLFWILLGPAFLFAILYANATEDQSWFSLADLAFFIILGLIVLARWLDQRSGQCLLMDGQVSTWKDFRRFLCIFVLTALLIWVVTNVIGNYLI
jgi:hypothetical protein